MPTGTSLDISEKADVSGSRGGVQSIERAFSLLRLISRDPGISLAELSKKAGLHNSTTFHIVRTMVDLGIVRQAKDTKKYHLGRVIFSLAASSSSAVELVATATPFLQSLAAATDETSHFGFRVGWEAVIAAKVMGGGAFQPVERVGGGRPLNCTALGKVLLADMTEAEFNDYLTVGPIVGMEARSITDPVMLRQELDRVRQSGIGFDDAEYDSEMRCIAAPVHDSSGRVIGAIGISGPIWHITLQRLPSLSNILKSAAAELSRELGYSPPE